MKPLLLCVVVVVMVVVVRGGEYCEVLDLQQQQQQQQQLGTSPLPTNLSVSPSMAEWSLNFTLWEGTSRPAACVRLLDTHMGVQVILYEEDCEHGAINAYTYLPRDALPHDAWTSLAVAVQGNTLTVRPPHDRAATLKGTAPRLPHRALQVTHAQGVEAAVGCRVPCPLRLVVSQEPRLKHKVREWRQDAVHFYVRAGNAFSSVQYEVVCTEEDGHAETREELPFTLGEQGGAGALHLVEAEWRRDRLLLRLDDQPLGQLLLPLWCRHRLHALWTLGDAAFGFGCDRREVGVPARALASTGQARDVMHPGVEAAITVAAITLLGLLAWGVYAFYYRRGDRQRPGVRHDDTELCAAPSGASEAPPPQQPGTATAAPAPDRAPPGAGTGTALLGRHTQLQEERNIQTWGPGPLRPRPKRPLLKDVFLNKYLGRGSSATLEEQRSLTSHDSLNCDDEDV